MVESQPVRQPLSSPMRDDELAKALALSEQEQADREREMKLEQEMMERALQLSLEEK